MMIPRPPTFFFPLLRLLHVVPPPLALAALPVGRMVALHKSDRGVRALVLRRLTGQVLAQTYATQLQQECVPFQFGLSTRAGTKAFARLFSGSQASLIHGPQHLPLTQLKPMILFPGLCWRRWTQA